MKGLVVHVIVVDVAEVTLQGTPVELFAPKRTEMPPMLEVKPLPVKTMDCPPPKLPWVGDSEVTVAGTLIDKLLENPNPSTETAVW